MDIGNLTIAGRLFLAPLAGISNYPFRSLARKFGASFCYSEMVSADALARNQEKTIKMLDMPKDEHPVGVQLFGSSPEYIARAVKVVEEFGPDLIDLNIGCPVRKVVKKNGGAALLKNLPLAGEIMAAAVENCSIPVTVKTRSGWSSNSDTYLELGKIAEKAGVSAITLHPRSRADGYKDKSDWSKIALLKKEVSIPVIGNGDIHTGQDAAQMLSETGCDAVMIGRAAMRNPFVFHQIKVFLEEGNTVPDMSIREIFKLMLEHAELMTKQYGEKNGILMMRKHLAWYTKGMRGGADLRRQLFSVESYQDIRKLFEDYNLNIKVPSDG